MLYETLSQPLIILAILGTGILAGLIFDVGTLVTYFCNKNKVIRQIIYFFQTISAALLLFYINLLVNYGRFRIYILLLFTVSFTLERFVIGKLWTKLLDKCYNTINKFKGKLKKHGKEKSKQV